MKYDPVKKTLGDRLGKSTFLRILMYQMLDLVLLRTWHIKRELKWIRPQLPKDAHILDAGSGYGQYLYFLSGLSRTWKLKGIDVKEDQVADCNSFFQKIGRKHVVFEVADLTQFSEPNQYHLALSVDVMEHIDDDNAVFKNLCQSLKPDGFLLLSTPSDRGGSGASAQHDESFIDEHVRNGYNRIELTDKLKKAGFRNIESKYSYGFPGHISWVLSIMIPMRLLRISLILAVLLIPYYLILGVFLLLLNWFDTRFKNRSGTGLIVIAQK